jgi:hypothetical protein
MQVEEFRVQGSSVAMKAGISMFTMGMLVVGLGLALAEQAQGSSFAPPINPRQVTVTGQVTLVFTGTFGPARPQYFTMATPRGPITVVVMPNTTSAGTKPLTMLRPGDRVRVSGMGGATQGGGFLISAAHIVIL